jgi:hypothetical protein
VTSTIYVAGASAEADIVAGYIEQLTDAGLTVTLDWTIHVRKCRAAGITDADLSRTERKWHAGADLDAVDRANFFWLVIPEKPSLGCWTELGAALAVRDRNVVIVSGDWKRFIFTELAARRFDTHEEALAWLRS